MILLAALLACTSEPAPPPAAAPPAVVAPLDPDAAELAALGIPGPGEDHPWRLVHHLHLTSAEAADSAAVAVTALGLRVEPSLEDNEAGESWELLAWEATPLSAAYVAGRRAELSEVAQSYGGSYEGWDAEPLR